MWVETLSNGKVRCVERFKHPLTEKYVKVSVTIDKDTKSNRKQAQIALQEKISAQIDMLLAPAAKKELTLDSLTTLYLDDLKERVKTSTYLRNKSSSNSMLEILGKEVLVEKLTAAYVKKCLAEKKEKPGTTNERLIRFKAMIRWGYENELIKDIRWLDKVKPLRDDEKKKKLEEKYLESQELSLLLENISIDKWRMLTELMALSGLRSGEAIALYESDIDFSNRVIHVTKTFDAHSYIITSPKTDDSIREVYMQDELYALCKKIKIYMAKERLMAGYKSLFFMSDINGEPLNYFSFNKYLKKISFQVLGFEVTTHFLRHTHVALLAEQGIALDIIARRLGHADSEITKRIYFHVTEKLKERDNTLLKSIKIL